MRQPVWFVSHGGGPSFFLEGNFEGLCKGSATEKFFRNDFSRLSGPPPSTILVISAHWENSDGVAFTSAPNPPQIYDYYGFPEHTYNLPYTPPGNPALFDRVKQLLGGLTKVVSDKKRGLDHGSWIPLLLSHPNGNIPVVQLSLHASLDPALHLAIGKALAPLRDEGVLIIGSGFITHDLQSMLSGARADKKKLAEYRKAMTAIITDKDTEARNKQLSNWRSIPHAPVWHPREEHLIPLLVAAGAAGSDTASLHADYAVLNGAAWSCHAAFGLPH